MVRFSGEINGRTKAEPDSFAPNTARFLSLFCGAPFPKGDPALSRKKAGIRPFFPGVPAASGKSLRPGFEGKAACTPPGPLKETLIVGNSKLCAAETSDRFKTPFGQGFPGRQAEKWPRPPFQSQSFTGRESPSPSPAFPAAKPDGDGRKDETRCGCRGISRSKARR